MLLLAVVVVVYLWRNGGSLVKGKGKVGARVCGPGVRDRDER